MKIKRDGAGQLPYLFGSVILTLILWIVLWISKRKSRKAKRLK